MSSKIVKIKRRKERMKEPKEQEENYKVKTFNVPFAMGEIHENIIINTSSKHVFRWIYENDR